MLSIIALTLIVMLFACFVLHTFFNIPRNVIVLFLVQPLAMAASPVMVLIGGILSAKIAPDASLSTLPLTLMILSLALSTILAAFIAKRLGRKSAANIGLAIAFLGALIASFAAQQGSFSLFLLASVFIGSSLAFAQQFRFAAIESVDNEEDIPKVLSILMLAGIFAAFLGPETAVFTQDLIPSPHGYAGSFLAIALMIIVAFLILQRFQSKPEQNIETVAVASRPLLNIIKQPMFIIAIGTSAIGFGLMSFLMTATPLSMHHMDGHSLQDTKWVIQSHIAAMFLPSLFTGLLVKRFGLNTLLFCGTIAYLIVVLIALAGQHVIHYWWALVLLGIGWNFLFLTGTSLLPLTYQKNERHKVQAANDFLIFFIQAIASLLAGWVLFKTSWHTLVYTSAPFIVALLILAIWYAKIAKLQR